MTNYAKIVKEMHWPEVSPKKTKRDGSNQERNWKI